MRRNQGDRLRLDSPDRIAIVDTSADRSYSYRALDAAMQSAAALISERITPGAAVGLLGENSAAWVVVFFAIQRAGGVPVPISTRLPADAVRFVAQDAELVLAFADGAAAETLKNAGVTTLSMENVFAAPVRTFGTVEPTEGALGKVLYTSGTTGHPKGVELSQESHLWVIDQVIGDTGERPGTTLISAPLYHMNALTNTQRLLASGGMIVLMPRFEPTQFLAAIERYRPEELSGVPPMFAMLGAYQNLIAETDVSSVRRITMGSAPTPAALYRSLAEWFPGCEVGIGYGTTESGPVVFAPHVDGVPIPKGSVGVAHPAVTLRLVDEHGIEQHTQGVLEVSSPAVLVGYRNRPDLPIPLTADGYHHTKDIFRRDADGFFFFVGREDDMFVTGGENVYPRSVEQVLESHPAVSQAVVLPLPDSVKGTKPVAFVTRQGDADVVEADLRTYVLERMEPFAHPRRVWFLDTIPLSPTNKADRAALLEMACSLSGVES